MKKTPKAEYERLIGEVDILLAVVSDLLTNAKTRTERTKHKEQLDMLLDERWNIMKLKGSVE